MSIGGVSLPRLKDSLPNRSWQTSLVISIDPLRINCAAVSWVSNRLATSPDRSESELFALKKPLPGDPSRLDDFPRPPSICDSGEETVMVSF